MGIIPSAPVGSRCTWSKEFFLSRDSGGIENCCRFRCVIYMHSLALHDHVTGALGFASGVWKGADSKSQRHTDKNCKGLTEGRQREVGKNRGLNLVRPLVWSPVCIICSKGRREEKYPLDLRERHHSICIAIHRLLRGQWLQQKRKREKPYIFLELLLSGGPVFLFL